MRLIDKLERALGRFAIPHLTLAIVIGQVGVFFAEFMGRADPTMFFLEPTLALHGQWWRFVSFLLIPPSTSLVFIAFTWWMFFLMGSALEEYWGDFRYNLFLFTGYALTVGLTILQPDSLVSNTFIGTTVFLAFAYINPNFELLIFFILPIKIRWLALVTWLYYGFQIAVGSWSTRLQVLAAIGSVLIFFGRDIWQSASHGRRRMVRDARKVAESSSEPEYRHRCRICGKTNLTDPQMDFRYCSKCEGEDCYCTEHIGNHEHTRSVPKP